MSIDIVRAIKAPWQNGGGFWRMLLGALVFCVPILGFISQGYLVEYLKKVSEGREQLGNIFEHGSQSFVTGFKYFVGWVLLFIPVGILVFIFAMLIGKDSKFMLESIYQGINIIFMIVVFIMTISFCTDFKISSFLNFKNGYLIIKENPTKFIVACAFSILVQLFYILCIAVAGIVLAFFIPLLMQIPLFGIILVIAMIFLTGAIMFANAVAITHIMGQFAAESKYFAQLKQQNHI